MKQPSATRILLKEFCDAKGLPELWIRRFADNFSSHTELSLNSLLVEEPQGLIVLFKSIQYLGVVVIHYGNHGVYAVIL